MERIFNFTHPFIHSFFRFFIIILWAQVGTFIINLGMRKSLGGDINEYQNLKFIKPYF